MGDALTSVDVQIVCELADVLKRHQLLTTGAHFIAHSFGMLQTVSLSGSLPLCVCMA